MSDGLVVEVAARCILRHHEAKRCPGCDDCAMLRSALSLLEEQRTTTIDDVTQQLRGRMKLLRGEPC